MNRALLIYPPFALPSGLPFQLLELAGYVQQRFGITIDLLDLNQAYFSHYFNNDERARLLQDPQLFYERAKYLPAIYGLYMDWLQEHNRLKALASDLLSDRSAELASWTDPFIQQMAGYAAVGFSLTYHQDDDLSQFFTTLALAKRLKTTSPETRVILGGALVNVLDSREVMEAFPFIDALFLKESEESLGLWLNRAGLAFEDIPNVVYRTGDQLISTPLQDNVQRGLTYPLPLTKEQLAGYFSPAPVISLQYKRGCAWERCRFCAGNANYFGYEQLDKRPVLVHKLEQLVTLGVRHINFSDQMLLPGDAQAIADIIQEHGWPLFWSFMSMPHAGFTPQLMEMLYRNGCRWITWGAESGCDRILERMNKPISRRVIESSVTAAYSAGIKNILMLIYGFPDEKNEELQETISLLEELKPYYDSYSFGGYHLMAGSAVFNEPATYGITAIEKRLLFSGSNPPISSPQYAHGPLFNRDPVIPEELLPARPIPVAEHYLLYCSPHP